ncbi:MAG: DUF1800 domain-containing protein [Chitinophagaceae bacterium]
MGNTMQRRQFLSRLTTRGHQLRPDDAYPQTAERSFNQAVSPRSNFKANGVLSGVAQYTGSWTEKEMIHLLRRTMFGAAKASVDKIKTMTMSQAVDFLIDNPVMPTTSPVNNYTTGTDTGGVAFGSSWIDANLPDPTDSTIRNTLNNNRLTNSFKPWWMGQLINQQTHILEKMTLFWSNHFGTDNNNNNRPKAIFQHYKILRKYGLGNFRDLLKQVTIDPHMLYFLSGYSSTKTAPNENYGRELQELFTVGKGPDSHYTEDDVKAFARTLTGWTVSQSATDGTYSSAYTASRHDINLKQFSAFYGNKKIDAQTAANGVTDVDTLIDIILQTNECAKFIVRRLYMWFVYSDINATVEANVIAPLADIFRASKYDIPTVLKALFKSEHFFDALNYGSIIKSPVDMYVSMIREFNVTLAAAPVDVQYQHWKNIYDKARLEGQAIGDPPNVAGWTAYYEAPSFYELWMSSSSIQTKATNLKAFANAGVKVSGVSIVIDSVAFNKQFADAGDPNAVVRNFIQYLLPVDDLTTDQKAAMKAFLVPPNESDAYWSNEWNRYLSSPATYYTEVKGVLDQLMRPIVAMAEYYLY